MELDKVIRSLYPNKEFVIYDNNLNGLHFIDESIVKPTEAEVTAAWLEITKNEKEENLVKEAARQAIFDRLGITTDEAAVLGL